MNEARQIQQRDQISFKALVEEGLRLALAKRQIVTPFVFKPVFGGRGWLTEDAEKLGGLAAVLREVNER